ncbi:MAG: hypothetical protein MI784_10575 [Cytophagales bacterium]|nr:hypothetical protein [Cytophagales bacterium]
MDITVTNIQILPQDTPADTPTLYCADIQFSESDTRYFRNASIQVRFDADENATMKEVQEIALAKAKDFLEEYLPKF